MSDLKVKDLMVHLSHCATVSENATLHDAVVAMEATRMMFQRWDYRPRIVLVYDEHFRIIGTLRHFEVLQALEPKYRQMGDLRNLSRFGFSREFVTSTYSRFMLWSDPLKDLCKKALELKVKDIMSVPVEGEFIDENAPISEAIHRMLMGNHPSLFVRNESGIQGILRMSDVASHVFSEMKKCGIPGGDEDK